ncbi:lysosomal alpha-mannosidase-like [Sitophilus oryzae]|uniref:Alpha-mannosidase n=1 Tax=Sitophilus oryzae TaxID=7048 RepID=A0A6J2XSV7_SITOR|nr:lysosomal alpha-mannosidase-like [Sitophilus oryzae]
MYEKQRQRIFALFLLLAGTEGFPSENNPKLSEANCGYESCTPIKNGYTNIHIVAHTHDDVGWLKTVDQSYYGSNSNTQKAGAQYILPTVMDSLNRNSNRKFIYVETAFFWKWWIKQSDNMKQEVIDYVNNGQLEFISGGWSMNDEAATHYHSIIDQMTWGLRRLNDTFGACGRPKIGWQIDPFGHSKEMANIFAQLGFDGYLVGRIDYQDKEYRWKTKTPEVVWRGSKSLGESSDIFTGVLYNGYKAPSGFCFDILCNDTPFIDDPDSFEYNVDDRVDDFLKYVNQSTQIYTTSNYIMPMGADFYYQNAENWFINLDKLIYYVNKRQESGSKFNLIYSTPSCYVKAVNNETQDREWVLKDDDFFPYGSDKHSYWTGYFTSRPALKRFERLGNNFLQVCKQLSALAGLGESKSLDNLREIMGVLQHHDAVSGTEKQHVTKDYARQLQKAIDECENVTYTALNKLINNETLESESIYTNSVPLKTCPLANVSQCATTENADNFVVTVYNPLSRPVDKLVRLPVKGEGYNVTDKEGNSYVNELLPIPDFVKNIPGRNSSATNDLYFVAENLPALGWKSFIISLDNSSSLKPLHSTKSPGSLKVNGSTTSFVVNDDTGLVEEVSINNLSVALAQNFFHYKGFVADNGNSDRRSSGAYIFRPDGSIKITNDTAEVAIFEGSLLSEARQNFNEYISQTVRVNKIENYIEFEWVVGPIPTSGPNGIEVVTKYSTKLATDSVFYTDSNGKEMLKRVRDYRPTWELDNSEPASGNYYPITSKIAIRDEVQGIEVAVLNDRAQGGSSLNDGEIEIMIHRNCLHDDGFGVGESLNETAFDKGLVIRGSHFLTVGNINDQNGNSISAIAKDIAQKKLLDSWTFVTPLEGNADEYKSKYIMEYSGLGKALPKNVQILTLEPWKDSTFLLRLEHLFDYDEDSVLSQSALVNLTDLFTGFEIVSLEETTLGANQWLKDSDRLKFKTNSTLEQLLNEDYNTNIEYATVVKNAWIEGSKTKPQPTLKDNLDELEISLNPSDIRTFIIGIKRF